MQVKEKEGLDIHIDHAMLAFVEIIRRRPDKVRFETLRAGAVDSYAADSSTGFNFAPIDVDRLWVYPQK